MKTRALEIFRNHHFWIIVAMFIAGLMLHYPQQLLTLDSSSIFASAGLTRHTVERVYLLAPIAYGSYFFYIRGTLISLGIAGSIMYPRALFISANQVDALFESSGVIVIGIVFGLLLRAYRKEKDYLATAVSQLEESRQKLLTSEETQRNISELLSRIVDGSPIATFVIDGKHKVLYWNQAIEALTRIYKEEIVGSDEHWRSFYEERRPILADLIVDSASTGEIERYYRGKCRESPLIPGAYVAEDFFPNLGKDGKWLHFTASPIRGSNGKIIGAIETLEDVTERKQIEENVHYYIQEATRAQEEERKRLARELHDDVAQSLLVLTQGLDFLGSTNRPKLSGKALKQAIDEMHARAVDALQNIRRYAQDLRPRILDDLGLIAALEWLTEDLAKNQAIDAGTEIAGKERKLPDETQLLIFRIAQEALNNVRKHARASRVTVRLEFLEDRLELTVSDNGRGFEVPKLLGDLASTGKLGLAGMRERVNLLQGKLAIKSTEGKGTTLYAVVPLP